MLLQYGISLLPVKQLPVENTVKHLFRPVGVAGGGYYGVLPGLCYGVHFICNQGNVGFWGELPVDKMIKILAPYHFILKRVQWKSQGNRIAPKRSLIPGFKDDRVECSSGSFPETPGSVVG